MLHWLFQRETSFLQIGETGFYLIFWVKYWNLGVDIENNQHSANTKNRDEDENVFKEFANK